MSRKDFKTHNVPVDVANFLDAALKAARAGRDESSPELPLTLGAQSRDEYIRLALAIVILATMPERNGKQPLRIVQDLVDRLERARQKDPRKPGL